MDLCFHMDRTLYDSIICKDYVKNTSIPDISTININSLLSGILFGNVFCPKNVIVNLILVGKLYYSNFKQNVTIIHPIIVGVFYFVLMHAKL